MSRWKILIGKFWAATFLRKIFHRKSSIGKLPGSVAADLFFPHGTSVLPAAAQPLRGRMSPASPPSRTLFRISFKQSSCRILVKQNYI